MSSFNYSTSALVSSLLPSREEAQQSGGRQREEVHLGCWAGKSIKPLTSSHSQVPAFVTHPYKHLHSWCHWFFRIKLCIYSVLINYFQFGFKLHVSEPRRFHAVIYQFISACVFFLLLPGTKTIPPPHPAQTLLNIRYDCLSPESPILLL